LPQVFPFKALLPAAGLEMEVSANTHVDSKEKQLEIVQTNPHSYLQVVKPYLKFNEEKDPEKHFPYSRQVIERFIAEKVMIQDQADTLYVYCQVNLRDNQRYLGLICNVAASDYYEGRIKVHENTLTEKENQLIDHIRICGAIGEPVLLTHFAHKDIDGLLEETMNSQSPDIDFTDEVDRRHMIYKITDHERIKTFQYAYNLVDDFYIADGHHRSAASAGFYKRECLDKSNYLAFLVPANHLHIDSFYRAYKSSSAFNTSTFIEKLKDHFDVIISDTPVVPKKARQFGLRTSAGWYRLEFRGDLKDANAVKQLDVSVLEDYVFLSMLDIQDSKTDKQLTFIKGSTPISAIDTEVQAGTYDLVFTVFPCDIEQVFRIADEGLIMPPKSTYIEPKLRTGLTVQLVRG
jgi:uncharacterized protein (DUF1015 family)